MATKELKTVKEIISELDTAVGMLMVPASKDKLTKEAMQKVSAASFYLERIISENAGE